MESAPRLRTIIIDDCAYDEICDFTGVYGGFAWPQSEAILTANNLFMKDHYEDTTGNINKAKLEAYCVKAKNYLDGKLLDGD